MLAAQSENSTTNVPRPKNFALLGTSLISAKMLVRDSYREFFRISNPELRPAMDLADRCRRWS